MLEIDRQNPVRTKEAFGKERLLEGNVTIEVKKGDKILTIDTTEGTRQFYIESEDGKVTIWLYGDLAEESQLLPATTEET